MVFLAMHSIVQNATQEAWLLPMRVQHRAKTTDLIPRKREHPSRPSLGEAVANGAR
jgi:hypothetical protein